MCYQKAFTEGAGDSDLMASAAKNYAKGAQHIARINKERDTKFEPWVYFYKEAITYFSKALQCGKRGKDNKWTQDLLTAYKACLEEALLAISDAPIRTRVAYIESYAQSMDDNTFHADTYQEMGTVLFHHAVVSLDK